MLFLMVRFLFLQDVLPAEAPQETKGKRRTFGRRLMKPVDRKAAAIADGCVMVKDKMRLQNILKYVEQLRTNTKT